MRPRRSVLFMPGSNARADFHSSRACSSAFSRHARRVIVAHEDARAQGRGVAVLDGLLIENLHVEDARRVVALAEAIEMLERGPRTA